MVTKINKRNGKIELLRFLFSVIIMIHHSRNLLGDGNCKFLGGSLAVEFFFIVSGYLMMATIERKIVQDQHTESLGKETLSFLFKKVKAVYPAVFIAWVISVLFIAIAKQKTLWGTAILFIDTFFEATVLKMSGLYSATANGVTWYISSMLLCMAILYPLIRKFPDMSKHIIIPLIVLFGLGYLSGTYGEPRNPRQWIGFTYKGNVRAMAEIGLGVICFHVVTLISSVRFTKIGKCILTILEWSLYTVVILYMYVAKASVRDYFFIIVFAAAIILSFSCKGIDAEWFNRRFFYWLGQYSLPLYLGHTYYSKYLNNILPEVLDDHQRMLIYVVCSVFTAFVIWILSNAVKKNYPQMIKFIKSIFIET